MVVDNGLAHMRLAKDWLESSLQQQLTPDLHQCLQDGIILCKLINRYWPGMISKIEYSPNRLSKTENIRRFLRACCQVGLLPPELFHIHDLLDNKNMDAVVDTVLRLAHAVPSEHETPLAPRRRTTRPKKSVTKSSSRSKVPIDIPQQKRDGNLSKKALRNAPADHTTRDTSDALGQPDPTNLYPPDDISHLPSSTTDVAAMPAAKVENEDTGERGEGGAEERSDDVSRQQSSPFPDHSEDDPTPESGSTKSKDSLGFRSPGSSSKSRDSGYGTSTAKRHTSKASVHLASLFDLEDEKQAHQESNMDAIHSSPYAPDGFLVTNQQSVPSDKHPNANLMRQVSSESGLREAAASSPPQAWSKLARLSQLPFGRKRPGQTRTPFHMRYQEWTEKQHVKQEPSDSRGPVPEPEQSRGLPMLRRPVSSMLPIINLNKTSTNANANTKTSTNTNTNTQGTEENDSNSKRRGRSLSHKLSKTKRDWLSSLRSDGSNQNSTKGGSKIELNEHPDIPEADKIEISTESLSVARRQSTGTVPKKTMPNTSTSEDQENLELLDNDGSVLASYKLGNVIGKGQFGTVHCALDVITGKMVAVKRIKLDQAKKDHLADVMEEAHLLQSLAHPNIVKYEGFIQDTEYINIVLEYVENGSLLKTLKAFGGKFPESLIAGYCVRILDGLSFLHEREVVHCDLKAANILTTKDGGVKLTDFGVSFNLAREEDAKGDVAGTPNWMAPEIIQLKGASTKSDIWSLGCTIVELCTGKPPYASMNAMSALYHIVEDEEPPIPQGLSETLTDFLHQCFHKDPSQRPTARALMQHPWVCQRPVPRASRPQSPPCTTSNITTTSDVMASSLKDHRSPSSSSSLSSASSFASASMTGSLPRVVDTSSQVRFAAPFPDGVAPRASQSTPFNHNAKPPRQSMLTNTLQKRYERAMAVRSGPQHSFVKETFRKGVVRCRACQLHIKKDALVCNDCGLICHDKCQHGTTCLRPPAVENQKHQPPSPPQAPQPSVSISTQLRDGNRKLTRAIKSVVRNGSHGDRSMSSGVMNTKHDRLLRQPSSEECIIS